MELEKAPICFQEFQLGGLRGQATVVFTLPTAHSSQAIGKKPQTIIHFERKYETTCNFDSKIYHAKIEDKLVLLEVYHLNNEQDGQPRKASYKFEGSAKIAHQGCWFQIINRQFCLIIVDTLGSIYVRNLPDLQDHQINQSRQLNFKINQVNQLWQVSQINFDDTNTNGINFIASANDEELIYIQIENLSQDSLKNECIFHQIEIHFTSSFQHRILKTLNNLVAGSLPLQDPIRFAAKINNTHFVVITAQNEIKICKQTPRNLELKKVSSNISIDASVDVQFKYCPFGFDVQNESNIDETVCTIAAFSSKSINLIQVSFSKRSTVSLYRNMSQVADQDYNEISAYKTLVNYEPRNKLNIFSVYLTNEYLIVEGLNSILEFVDVIEPKNQINFINPYPFEPDVNFEGLQFLNISQEGIIFAIYRYSINIISGIDHPLLFDANMTYFQGKVFNKQLLQNFTDDQKEDLPFCIQKLTNQEYINQLADVHDNIQRNLRIINMVIQGKQFRQSILNALSSQSGAKLQPIIADILEDNLELMIHLKSHLRLVDEEQIINKLHQLMEDIQNYLLNADNRVDDQDLIRFDSTRLGSNQQIYPILQGYQVLNLQILLNHLYCYIIIYHLYSTNGRLWNELEILVRQLVSVNYFLSKSNSVVKLMNNVQIFIHRSDFKLFSISSKSLKNCNNKSMNILFRDFPKIDEIKSLPFLLEYLFEIRDFSGLIMIADILKLSHANVNYYIAFAYNHEKRIQDFKRLAIKIGHQVTAMNDVEFKDGPWAREYLTQDLNFQMVQNILSQEQKLVSILLKHKNLYDQSKIILALHYLQSSEGQSTFQKLVFRQLFMSALNENISHLNINLLKMSNLVSGAFDELSYSRQKVSIMESFINKYCSSASLEELHNFGLERNIVMDIYNYIEKWNIQSFRHKKSFYQEMRRQQSAESYLVAQCKIFYQQNKFLVQKGLMTQSIKILLFYLDFLDQLQGEDVEANQVLYCLLLEEKLRVISLVDQQSKIRYGKLVDARFDSIIEYVDDTQNLNLQQFDLQSIQKDQFIKTEVQLKVYKMYRLKVKTQEDLVPILLAKNNYPLLVRYWASGDLYLFFEGINLMISHLHKQTALRGKLLKQLMRCEAFKIYHNQILDIIIASLIQINQVDHIVDLIRELELQDSIFKIGSILSEYQQNQDILEPLMLEQLEKMISLRNEREHNITIPPAALPVFDIVQCMQNSKVRDFVASDRFLQETM